MNKEKDEELDNFFRKGMEDPVNEAAFRDNDWDAMEQLLDQGKKRPAIVYWLSVIGSAAALILIFLGYLFFKPYVVKPGKKDQLAAAHQSVTKQGSNPFDNKKQNNGIGGEPVRKSADIGKQQTTDPAKKNAEHQAQTEPGKNGKSFFTLSSGKVRRNTAGSGTNKATVSVTPELNSADKNPQPNNIGSQALIADNTVKNRKEVSTADQHNAPVSAPTTNAVAAITDKKDAVIADNATKQKVDTTSNNLAATAAPTVKVKTKGTQKLGNGPVFALGVVASSDLNGVNSSFQQTKIGGNFGALLSVTFAQKWTITTGASYDIKPYLTSFSNYHTIYQFPNPPTSVNANCRMLEIPLTLNYQVYKKQANAITFGTGLSSYFMLREDYKFNYSNANSNSYYYYYSAGPSTYTVKNKNRNIFSVLNLNATYIHQVNSKMGISVQPYLKIPLANVGASQVRLQTTGVALGLNWNLNGSSKPK